MKRTEHKTPRLIIRPLKTNDYNTWYDAHVNGLPQQSKVDHLIYVATPEDIGMKSSKPFKK